MPANQPTELSVAEAARMLGITLQYAYSLLYAGQLKARRENGRWLIERKAVVERMVRKLGRAKR
jgi:excisionase family DNA binding protein